MEQKKQIHLTSAEVSQLWAQYMNDSASICILSYFLEKAEDKDVLPIIEHALELSKRHIQVIVDIFTEEKYAIPEGFSLEKDVNLSAPRLYSDLYVLRFLLKMSKIGLTTYSSSIAFSVRQDITEYFKQCQLETINLFELVKKTLLEKGIYERAPYYLNFEEVEFIEKQGFIYDVIGDKRPMSTIEVSHLYFNSQRNALGVTTLVGFSQVAKTKVVTQYFQRGIDIANKHIALFSKKLKKENLPISNIWDTDVTNSTSYTFSEKLMMFFVSTLIALGTGFYGVAISQSPRVDLATMYNRLLLEIQLFSEDGANIMIKNKWLEQPPLVANRNALAKVNFE